MSQATIVRPAQHAYRAPTRRSIAYRTYGRTHGPITRLMSPGDLGETLKPFVFLDYFEAEDFHGRSFPAHPHSGIATHTTLLQGTFDYGDSTGQTGTLRDGNVEWMQAGEGVWHWGAPRAQRPVRGYQLWIALPTLLEHAPAESHYLETTRVPSDGAVRVLLGKYAGLASPIPYDEALTYLHVTLQDRERWTFQPGAGHSIAWLAVHRGALAAVRTKLERELVVFDQGEDAIDLEAIGRTEFVIGSARPHEHPLVCGAYSVHTSLPSLLRGEETIASMRAMPLVADAIRRTRR